MVRITLDVVYEIKIELPIASVMLVRTLPYALRSSWQNKSIPDAP